MIGAILGGLSAVASSISAIKNFQSAQDAQKSANLYGQQFAGIAETDKYKAVKSADISSLLNQQTAAQTSQAIQAVQGMGPEAAAGVVGIINQQANEANIKAAEEQAKLDAQMALSKAEGAQGVEARNIAAQRQFKQDQLEGAKQAESDFYNAGIAGVTGAISGLGTAAAGLATSEQFDYPGMSLAQKKSRKAGQVGQSGLYGLSTVPTYQEYLTQQNQNQGMNLLGIQ
jgi:hypothetical protein